MYNICCLFKIIFYVFKVLKLIFDRSICIHLVQLPTVQHTTQNNMNLYLEDQGYIHNLMNYTGQTRSWVNFRIFLFQISAEECADMGQFHLERTVRHNIFTNSMDKALLLWIFIFCILKSTIFIFMYKLFYFDCIFCVSFSFQLQQFVD